LLYRYNPERALTGENPLILDSRAPSKKVQDFLLQQTRFKMLTKSRPEDAKRLWQLAQHDAEVRYRMYEYLAQRKTEQVPVVEKRQEDKLELAEAAPK
jgi:pyruvate-ferredoxin/flavodoxin oxidoreductase